MQRSCCTATPEKRAASPFATPLTNAEGKTTSFAYDSAGTLSTITHPDQQQQHVRSVHVRGMVDAAAGSGTLTSPAPLVRTAQIQGEVRDALGLPTTFTTDRFGLTTSSTDALGSVTTWERNSHGLVTRMLAPDPDGPGPLPAPETLYQYDSRGNLTAITHPDGSAESWTWDLEFNVPTSYTDPLGNQTFYVLDSATGLVLQQRRIVGLDDRSSSETDDVLTGFTYTAAPVLAGDPPAGLVQTVTDPLGRLTQFAYNARGLVVQITYAVGTADEASVAFEYNAADMLTAEIDELGRRTEYEYDQLDRLTRIILPDPDGAGPLASPVWSFQYDNNNRLVKETDPLGRETSYEYNDRGRLVQTIRPDHDGDGNPTVTTMTYTARGELETHTDPLGRATGYLRDALGRTTQITRPDPDGAGPLSAPVTTFAFDKLGRQIEILDPLNNLTATSYENFGRRIVTTAADPDGAGPQAAPQTTRDYDAAGNLVSVTDALGRVTAYQYDQLHRLVTVTLPDPDGAGPRLSPAIQYQYDKAGNLRFETDPLGNVTEYRYDHRNRLVGIISPDPDGAGPLSAPEITYTLDAAGQRTGHTDPLGRMTMYAYDGLSRLIQVTLPDPDGPGPQAAPVISYTYDALGNLLSETDPLGKVTSYTYDSHNNRITNTDPLGGVTSFAYDDAGSLLSLTDPVGNTTSWTYDGLGRTVQEINELGNSRYFGYDAVGNLIERSDRNGRVRQFDYDNLYRRTEERWLDGASTVRTMTWTYDAASQLLAASDPAAAYTYTYDGLGRASSVAHSLAGLAVPVVLSSTYNPVGNRTQLATTIGTTADFVTNYSYDNLHRMTGIQQHGVSGGNAVAAKRVDFSYDAAGQWQTIRRYEDLTATTLVAQTGFTFDNAGRLTNLTHTQPGAAGILADYDWTYDVASRVTSFTSLSDSTVTYSYDDTDQLIAADYDYQADEAHGYDANGNRTTSGYSTGTNNRLLSDRTYDYEYDAEGNRTRRVNIATGESTDYTWDHRNRLTKIVSKDAGSAVTNSVEYTYDVQNRRVAKLIGPGIGPAQIEHLIYDGERSERGNAGDHIVLRFENAQLTNRYLHGPAVDQILADEQLDSLANPGNVLWPLTDNLGTVRDLADFDPATGLTAIANHLTYNAFGQITAETDAAVDHLFAYTGRERDEESDLYHYRARYYDAATGRFISQDPIGFVAGDANVYVYVGNGPTNATDPSGEFVNFIVGLAIGGGLDLLSQTLIEGRGWEEINWYRFGVSVAVGAVLPGGLGATKDALGAMRAANACRSAIQESLQSIGQFVMRNRVVKEMMAKKMLERALEQSARKKLAEYAADELAKQAAREFLRKQAAMQAAKKAADAMFGPETRTQDTAPPRSDTRVYGLGPRCLGWFEWQQSSFEERAGVELPLVFWWKVTNWKVWYRDGVPYKMQLVDDKGSPLEDAINLGPAYDPHVR